MPVFLDITDRNHLNQLLSALQATTPARWGTMNAQQMIEHLVNETQYSNGIKSVPLESCPEDAAEHKQKVLYSPLELPKGITGPDDDGSERTRSHDLPAAIAQFNKELDNFQQYFSKPGATAVHGGFGALNKKEWELWHGKHFYHHFKQFGLVG